MSEPVSIDSLKQRFPVEVVRPFGEVLVVPSKLFRNGWEPALEAQGHRVFASEINGEATFLVRLEKGDSKKVETPRNLETKIHPDEVESIPVPPRDRWKRWRSRETRRLKDMVEQGLGLSEMAEALGRTTTQIERKIQRLQRKGELKTATLGPASENGMSNPVASGGKTPNSVSLGDEDRAVRELLQASLHLFPRYPVACRILLTDAASKLADKGERKSG